MASPPPPEPVPFMAASASLLTNNNFKGVLLAILSSAFIGSSFIIKKKGLKRAGASGPRASECNSEMPTSQNLGFFLLALIAFLVILLGSGGYGYLLEPLWWMGMITSKF